MPTTMRLEEWEVNKRLSELGLARDVLIDTVRACVTAYGGVTDNDPPSARGYEPWRFGTRHLRELLLPGDVGWAKDDTANLSSIRHDDFGIKIIVLNADDNAGNPDPNKGPRNRLKKGILHERAIGSATAWLPGLPKPFQDPAHRVWYLCIHINGDNVLSELSQPAAIEGGFIVSWKERIIILKGGEWSRLDFGEPDGGEDNPAEFEITVRRK